MQTVLEKKKENNMRTVIIVITAVVVLAISAFAVLYALGKDYTNSYMK